MNRQTVKDAFAASMYAPAGFNFNDSLYLLKITNIPWTATKSEVQAFLSEINILNGVNGIHFIIDETKNAINQAFIQLETRRDYSVAQNYNNEFMDGVRIKGMN